MLTRGGIFLKSFIQNNYTKIWQFIIFKLPTTQQIWRSLVLPLLLYH